MEKSPREVRTFKKLSKLKTDNKFTKDYWIRVDYETVTIVEQRNGESAKNCIVFKKSQFNRLIDWYNRKQTLNQ